MLTDLNDLYPDAATDAAYEEALRTALLGGINLVDTFTHRGIGWIELPPTVQFGLRIC